MSNSYLSGNPVVAAARDLKNNASWSARALWKGHATSQGREERRAVAQWRDRHHGERCVIMGNGPSLNHTDLSLLEGETVFGLNRIYLMYDRIGFVPTYHVTVNRLVVEQSVPELRASTIPLFTTYNNHSELVGRPDVYFLNRLWSRRFHRNAAHGVWEGVTVTFVAMQLAYFMGFREVVLVGVDHNFVTQGTPHQTITSAGADPNHFDPNYFGKGFRWQLPDLEMSEVAFRLAREAFEKDGRRIVDATVGGKLEVFDKVSLEQALG